MRGYQFYLYFENSKTLKSYFLSNSQIKSRNMTNKKKNFQLKLDLLVLSIKIT